MKITPSHLTCILAALCALSLTSCKPRNAATEKAAQELNELRDVDIPLFFDNDAVAQNAEELELLETIARFSKSEDVHASNDKGLTMLHLACLFKKHELARCLLQDGADPHRRCFEMVDGQKIEGEDALDFVFYGLSETSSAQEVMAMLDLLVAHGVSLNRSHSSRPRPLDLAGGAPDMEELFLHVLKQTEHPEKNTVLEDGTIISSLTWPAFNLWPSSMSQLIQLGAQANDCTGADRFPIIYIVFNGQELWNPQVRECCEILLKHGADINQCDESGRNAIFGVCKILVEQRKDDFDELGLIEKVAYMLEKGADPTIRANDDLVYPGFCAHDFLMMRPSVLQALRDKGFELKEPALAIPDDDLALLATLCRAQQTDMQPQAFAPHVKRLQDILTASPEVTQHELYPTAVEVVLKYLIAIDEAAANKFISELPSWYAQRDWSKLDSQITPLLHALQDIHEYVIDSKVLIYVALKLHEVGDKSGVIEVLQMLSRCPDREPIIANLMQHESPDMRCGAFFAQLLAANLPLPKDGMVDAWLTQREQKADSDAIAKAVLLTSQSELWFGNMPVEKRDAMIQAMADIGATEAAEKYLLISEHLENPEKLDEIMSADLSWYRDLEVKIASFIWEHREEFFEKAKAAPQTPEAHQPIHIHNDSCGCGH